jgi:hypothetical protein
MSLSWPFPPGLSSSSDLSVTRKNVLRRVQSAALAIGLALIIPAQAAAQDPTEGALAAAREMFKDGKDLEAKGAWADALAMFKKVAEVKMTPQVRFHIALCDEKLGRLVSAINGFELAAQEAGRAGKSAADVAENAPPRAAALRKRVAVVNLVVKGRLSHSRILMDGAPVAAALIGSAIPVDPGRHTVELQTKGKIVFSKDLDLEEKNQATVDIEVNDVDPPPPPPIVPKVSTSARPPQPDVPEANPSKLPAALVGTVGILGFIGAGVFLGLRESTIAEVGATCSEGGKQCDPDLEPVAGDGEKYTTAVTALTIVGGVGLATAGVLWIVSLPPSKDDPAKTKLGLAPTPTGLRLLGTF